MRRLLAAIGNAGVRFRWWLHCLLRLHQREVISMPAGRWIGCAQCGEHTKLR